PAVVSTRPFGLTRMTLAGMWQYAELAPLSAQQQRQLVHLWFQAAYRDPSPTAGPRTGDDAAATPEHAVETQTDRVVHAFMAEVSSVGELRRLAGVPLFLLLLIGLRLSGIRLPTRRFEVYARAVDQLLEDHPAR